MSKDHNSVQFDYMRKKLSSGSDKKNRNQPKTFNKAEVILWGHYRASMILNGLADYTVLEITVGQLAKGIDELYKDPANAKIRIADAVYAVKKRIRGASGEDMEKVILFLRGDRRDPSALWVRDSKGKILKSIAFP
ncbi:MAG: hypothetical protein PHN75_13335 [Syntrophales bacterium]|nr:hypothetical protein [Syntrophales bacterium]